MPGRLRCPRALRRPLRCRPQCAIQAPRQVFETIAERRALRGAEHAYLRRKLVETGLVARGELIGIERDDIETPAPLGDMAREALPPERTRLHAGRKMIAQEKQALARVRTGRPEEWLLYLEHWIKLSHLIGPTGGSRVPVAESQHDPL